MTIHDWLRNAIEDARRRGLPALEPLLQGLARSTAALRDTERSMDADEGKLRSREPGESRDANGQ